MKDWQRFTGSSLKRSKYWLRKESSRAKKLKEKEKIIKEELASLHYDR